MIKRIQSRWRKIFKHTAWISFRGTNGGEIEIVGFEKRLCWCEWLWWSDLNYKTKKKHSIRYIFLNSNHKLICVIYRRSLDYQTQNVSRHCFPK